MAEKREIEAEHKPEGADGPEPVDQAPLGGGGGGISSGLQPGGTAPGGGPGAGVGSLGTGGASSVDSPSGNVKSGRR